MLQWENQVLTNMKRHVDARLRKRSWNSRQKLNPCVKETMSVASRVVVLVKVNHRVLSTTPPLTTISISTSHDTLTRTTNEKQNGHTIVWFAFDSDVTQKNLLWRKPSVQKRSKEINASVKQN
jgi:hypothetical protein